MEKKKKIILIVCSIILAILLIVSVTYAWFFWRTREDQKIGVNVDIGDATITFDGGANITGLLEPTLTKEEGISKIAYVECDFPSVMFSMYLHINEIDDELKDESFKWELYKNDEDTPIGQGDFSNCEIDGDVELLNGEVITYPDGDKYTLYLWIDGLNYDNDPNMAGKSFNFDLYADNIVVTTYQKFQNAVDKVANWFESQYNNPTSEEYLTWIDDNGGSFPTASAFMYSVVSEQWGNNSGVYYEEGNLDYYILEAAGFPNPSKNININSAHTVAFLNEETGKVCVDIKKNGYGSDFDDIDYASSGGFVHLSSDGCFDYDRSKSANERFQDAVDDVATWFESQYNNPTNADYLTWIDDNGGSFPTCATSNWEDINDCWGENNGLYYGEGNLDYYILDAAGFPKPNRNVNIDSVHTVAFLNEDNGKICVIIKENHYDTEFGASEYASSEGSSYYNVHSSGCYN